jgi:protoheme IX farnesyltransferase
MAPHAATPIRAWIDLAKPRLNALVVFAVGAAYYIAAEGPIDWWRLVLTVVGAGLVAVGSSALNMVLERPFDAMMERTKDRPLPVGAVSPRAAAVYGAAVAASGLALLALRVGALAASIALVIFGSYLFCYTPLKRRTNLNTIVGAVPGALPAVLGWAAARDDLATGAWILFAIVFLWQIPHFLAIARLHSADYLRGGFRMLSAEDEGGFSMGRQAVVWSLCLVPVTLLPALTGIADRQHFWLALILGGLFVGFAIDFAVERGRVSARRLFIATLVYLPLVFGGMAVWKL